MVHSACMPWGLSVENNGRRNRVAFLFDLALCVPKRNKNDGSNIVCSNGGKMRKPIAERAATRLTTTNDVDSDEVVLGGGRAQSPSDLGRRSNLPTSICLLAQKNTHK